LHDTLIYAYECMSSLLNCSMEPVELPLEDSISTY
jgi:hypothetical protein